jgi:hypothetical protein
MKQLSAVLWALIILISLSPAQTKPEQLLSQDDEVRRILVEHIRGPYIAYPERYEIICVSFDDKDPSKELLARLQRISERFKAGSACVIDDDDGSSVKDKKTGKHTVMLYVDRIRKIDAKTISAEAGSYLANMGSEGCLYTLTLEIDVWKISGEEKCWIS